MKYDVFISSKSEDYPLAEKVYDYLVNNGLSVFLASKELEHIGEADYADAIDTALDKTTHMIVVSSSLEHINHKWVHYEWSTFRNDIKSGYRNGNLLTILDSAIQLKDLPAGLRHQQSFSIHSYTQGLLGYLKPVSQGGTNNKTSKQDVPAKQTTQYTTPKPVFKPRPVPPVKNLQAKKEYKFNFKEKVEYYVYVGLFLVVVFGLVLFFNKQCSKTETEKILDKMETKVDTVSYAIGMAQTDGLTQYLSETLKVDTTLMDDFIRGLNEMPIPSQDDRKKAHQSGTTIRMQIDNRMIPGINYELFGNDSTKTIRYSLFLAGFTDGCKRNYEIMDLRTAKDIANRLMKDIRTKRMMEQYGDYKKECEDFLKKNATKPGVITLPSGTQYKIIKKGNGIMPHDSATVTAHYKGMTIDGTIFDSSYKRGEPSTFPLNKLIVGWQEAFTHLPEGTTAEIYIPQDKAYGERRQGNIKPFSTLIFYVELLKVKN